MEYDSYIPKNLYSVLTNDKKRIIVKSTADILEKMMQEDKIKGWSVIEIFKIK